jgi:hypothetical protein
MRRIGDNEAITISWRKFTPDFMRKLEEKVQGDRHPTYFLEVQDVIESIWSINHNSWPFSETRMKNRERLLKMCSDLIEKQKVLVIFLGDVQFPGKLQWGRDS